MINSPADPHFANLFANTANLLPYLIIGSKENNLRANANVVARHLLQSWAFLEAKKWWESVVPGASSLTTAKMPVPMHAKKTTPVI